jgi:hypothetical protein
MLFIFDVDILHGIRVNLFHPNVAAALLDLLLLTKRGLTSDSNHCGLFQLKFHHFLI